MEQQVKLRSQAIRWIRDMTISFFGQCDFPIHGLHFDGQLQRRGDTCKK